MRILSSLIIVVGICSVALVGQPVERTIEYAPNMSITDQLLPEDRVVVVHRSVDYQVLDPEPSPRDILEGLLRGRHGTAVIVDITAVSSELVDKGRWIETVLNGTVVETLSTAFADGKRVSSLPVGNGLIASLDGGELSIGKALVRTSGKVAVPPKERYLLFLAPYVDPETGHRRLGADPLMVKGNQLVALPGARVPLVGLTLDDVRRLARK